MSAEQTSRFSGNAKLALSLLGSALALGCLLAVAALWGQPMATLALLAQPTSTPSPTATPSPTFVPTPTSLPTATQMPTPTATPSQPRPHQLLARPFDEEQKNEPSRYYPYGTTARGKYRVHRGSDFPNDFGSPVFAAAKGRVVVAGTDQRVIHGERVGFYGQLVIIQLEELYRGQKVYVLYGHLSKVLVSFLQEVDEGDLIGEVGMTGVAIGPHLHLEVRLGKNSYEQTRNPELWLKPLPGKGTLAGVLTDPLGQAIPEQGLTIYRSDSPDQRWQDATTYTASEINPDDEWRENYVVGDIPAGSYILKAYVNGHLYAQEFDVHAGELTFLPLQTAPTGSS
jgi:murein DD-endopeptidase MepM/ murein hydrolase activator NlpD